MGQVGWDILGICGMFLDSTNILIWRLSKEDFHLQCDVGLNSVPKT